MIILFIRPVWFMEEEYKGLMKMVETDLYGGNAAGNPVGAAFHMHRGRK